MLQPDLEGRWGGVVMDVRSVLGVKHKQPPRPARNVRFFLVNQGNASGFQRGVSVVTVVGFFFNI